MRRCRRAGISSAAIADRSRSVTRCISGSAPTPPTLLFTKFGMLPWFGMLAGGVISALIALALGYPCFRLRGHYFAIATIVIAEIALLLFQNWDWAGAALGIDIPVRGDSWLNFQFRAASCRTSTSRWRWPRRLARDLVAGGFQMGLLVARGEGQSGSRRKPRRRRVQFQDGRGRGLGVPHRDRRRASMRSSCPISIPKASWASTSRC